MPWWRKKVFFYQCRLFRAFKHPVHYHLGNSPRFEKNENACSSALCNVLERCLVWYFSRGSHFRISKGFTKCQNSCLQGMYLQNINHKRWESKRWGMIKTVSNVVGGQSLIDHYMWLINLPWDLLEYLLLLFAVEYNKDYYVTLTLSAPRAWPLLNAWSQVLWGSESSLQNSFSEEKTSWSNWSLEERRKKIPFINILALVLLKRNQFP